MANVKWIKITVDMFDDEKIKIIQSMPEGDSLLIIWIKLITLAGKTNDGGYIYISDNMPYTDEMLSVIMNKPLNTIRLALNTFNSLGMIENDTKGIYLLNFEKHQSLDKLEKIKEQNRLRVQKCRENKKMLECNVTETLRNAIDIDIEEEKEIDIDIIKKNNKFIKPTIEEVQQYCLERNNNINAEHFIDYYDANGWKVGKNPMKDWKAAIRTWEKRNDNKPIKKEIAPEFINRKQPSWVGKEIKEEYLSDEEAELLEKLLSGELDDEEYKKAKARLNIGI